MSPPPVEEALGLTSKQKFRMILAGILLGAVSFIGSLVLAVRAQDEMGLQTSDGEWISAAAGVNVTDKECEHYRQGCEGLRKTAIKAYMHAKNLSNAQSIATLAIGAGMGLMSIGFSLFLIGAEGAFSLQSKVEPRGPNIVLASTAPGVLVFVLATVLVYKGADIEYELETRGSDGYDQDDDASPAEGPRLDIPPEDPPIPLEPPPVPRQNIDCTKCGAQGESQYEVERCRQKCGDPTDSEADSVGQGEG